MQLESGDAGFEAQGVSPFREMGAYEALWSRPGTTFASLAARFAERPGSVRRISWRRPILRQAQEEASAAYVKGRFAAAGVERFGPSARGFAAPEPSRRQGRVHGAGEYPPQLRDAAHPVALLTYQGWWDLAASPSVAVVGTRTAAWRSTRSARRSGSPDPPSTATWQFPETCRPRTGMTKPNWTNRTIWTGDNLDVMRSMNSETVDLIYLDPPFED